jgi:hypothetical protein
VYFPQGDRIELESQFLHPRSPESVGKAKRFSNAYAMMADKTMKKKKEHKMVSFITKNELQRPPDIEKIE